MKSTVIFVLALAAGSIFGTTVFGPVSYYRTTGRPNVYDTTFIAYDTTVACTLIVLNGDESGGHRLSSASVELNGAEIISESDFNQHIGQIVRVVSLQSNNSLHFRLRSAPGAYLTLSIHRPCDVFISLTVDTVVGDSACFSVNAGGWGSLTYSFDFDGDGTYDTTTTAPTICHTYEEPDTYLVVARVEDEVGCEAEDSDEVVIKELEYTFEAESLWSYDFNSLGLDYFDEADLSISDNGNLAIIKTHGWAVMFRKGNLIAVYDSAVNDGVVSHNGNYALIIRNSFEFDYQNVDFDLVDSLGNIQWRASSVHAPIPLVEPFISDNDSLIGVFDGGWQGNISSMGEIFFNQVSNRAAILSKNGVVLDTNTQFFGEGMIQGKFRSDLKYFVQMAINGVFMNIYDKNFSLVKGLSPVFHFAPDSTLSYYTFPNYYFSRQDNHIYAYWGYSKLTPSGNRETFWEIHPDTGITIEAVCIDSIGNIVWRRETPNVYTNFIHLSQSGKYTIGYSYHDPPKQQVILWLTQSNEILWEKDFSEAVGDSLEYATIYEHPETGHTLIEIGFTDTLLYLYTDGSRANINNRGVYILCSNPRFGYRKIGNTISIYKVRW